ncbi:N-acetylglucosaminyldiphosphoundecaprenol N-acetyl-beta-D-mannosaminyltransferase [Acaryochloris thomasi RCC1774]|uniref:N-acetylglucosaminyldiphosphoundecaprenol N-acetyl-beta-D-mannosaminyltransferase n=1 Tax=Acaryochloris thomasi RCC1774 TaxID=1764569 RepID=A0A2W1JT15_9CYAN|nr:WecB/TagA/CpsF family glycosyltransferase [Acaryochloris thomasi]PZD74275.1 N-acetylglucosaminyldiphosphoundecaprenol N-acetyl-beta-D-mannosaminyltransferase [Acaryochloris thomasi RCC1774]
MNQAEPPRRQVIGISINPLSLSQHVNLILGWATQNESRAVYVANVHMLMEARWNPDFRQVLHAADLVTPDGMPLVWMLRLLGIYDQERVAGMDLLRELCVGSQSRSIGVLFLGSSAQILAKMRQRLDIEYPSLNIVGMDPLPFRPLTPSEDRDLINKINQSKAGLLLLSLGCPKQEKWIAAHRGRVNATMIGLGGVFPVYAGLQAYAPQWARDSGLEWAYRLCQEPGRLWRRYATTIPPFLWLAAQQLANRSSKH